PLVKRYGFGRVPGRIIAMLPTIPQRPPHLRGVRLSPPAVQFREIDSSIDEHLHPARATGLPGPPRGVQPDIYPLHQALGQMHVVITEEDHMRAGLGPPDEMRPFLN